MKSALETASTGAREDRRTFQIRASIAVEDDADGLLLAPISDLRVDATQPLYRVAGTGRRLWLALSQPQSLISLAAELERDHAVSPHTLHADIAGFLDDLQRHHLIRAIDGPDDSPVPGNQPIAASCDGDRDPERLGPTIRIRLLRATLERGAQFRMRVSGVSMQPFLREGDTLILEACDPATLQPGDIVAFTTDAAPDRLVIHRIVQRLSSGNTWICRGDNATANDSAITGDRIFGRVVQAQRANHRLRLGLGWERKWIARLSSKSRLQRLQKR